MGILLRDKIVKLLLPLIEDYTSWNSDHGLYLPEEFATDPTGWKVVLYKISRSFELLEQLAEKDGEYWDVHVALEGACNSDIEAENKEKMNGLNQEIQEGLELLGKHITNFVDEKYAQQEIE